MDNLLLITKNDIPFRQAQLIIHQPTIKEIALIGEHNFFVGCQYLNFSKKSLDIEDNSNLDNYTDFEVLMTMLRNKNTRSQQIKTCIQLVLALMFPDYKIIFLPMSILLQKQEEQEKTKQTIIDKDNFESFKNIVSKMFCLKENSQQKYNPGGPQARELVKKFQERQRILAKIKGGQGGMSVLDRYLSILSVGEQKDINTLREYTIYQLFDQFRRFNLKREFDMYIQAKMAGASDLNEVENWMGDLHSDTL